MSARYTIGCTLLCLTAAISQGQTWFTQNYHFTGPPAPRAEEPVDPVVADLLEIQRTTMAILRKANFAGDYEAALAAARQAAANAQLIGTLSGRDAALKRPQNTSTQPEKSASPSYLIALTDQTVHSATSMWSDGTMLHFLTRDGVHEQVRLDLVDRPSTGRLNADRRR